MIAKDYGKSYTLETLRRKSGINREGVSLLGISEAIRNKIQDFFQGKIQAENETILYSYARSLKLLIKGIKHVLFIQLIYKPKANSYDIYEIT